jgi:hypothetical protein
MWNSGISPPLGGRCAADTQFGGTVEIEHDGQPGGGAAVGEVAGVQAADPAAPDAAAGRPR